MRRFVAFVLLSIGSPTGRQRASFAAMRGDAWSRWFRLTSCAVLVACAAFTQYAAAQTTNSATLSWTPPPMRLDGTPITGALSFNIYQGVKGQPKVKVGTVTQSGTTITTGLLGATEYCWEVSAFEGADGPESARSAEACKAFPQSAPGTFTLTVT